ncbi:hypothetical protein B0H11DRAFT_2346232 [Mycena galericulata]|nr:hypothetical protein B0H11DRAFT_2346232 [Mycena galericulata]
MAGCQKGGGCRAPLLLRLPSSPPSVASCLRRPLLVTVSLSDTPSVAPPMYFAPARSSPLGRSPPPPPRVRGAVWTTLDLECDSYSAVDVRRSADDEEEDDGEKDSGVVLPTENGAPAPLVIDLLIGALSFTFPLRWRLQVYFIPAPPLESMVCMRSHPCFQTMAGDVGGGDEVRGEDGMRGGKGGAVGMNTARGRRTDALVCSPARLHAVDSLPYRTVDRLSRGEGWCWMDGEAG